MHRKRSEPAIGGWKRPPPPRRSLPGFGHSHQVMLVQTEGPQARAGQLLACVVGQRRDMGAAPCPWGKT